MEWTDTHTHLYLPEFEADREAVIRRALDAGVRNLFLPNIDAGSIPSVMSMANEYPKICHPMLGLHPGSVDNRFETQLEELRNNLVEGSFCAVGEIGIDLYHDKTYRKEQVETFTRQLQWAMELSLPAVIHIRNAFPEVFEVIERVWKPGLTGIFHCFSGNVHHARKAIDMGFFLGIGGVITFRNPGLQQVVKQVPLEHLVLETDAPYLAPVPYRGKRNESSYIPLIGEAVAEIKDINQEEVAEVTTRNARKLFFKKQE
ncbi:MAG: TatD family hydrolase [Bacteroidales bacterium]